MALDGITTEGLRNFKIPTRGVGRETKDIVKTVPKVPGTIVKGLTEISTEEGAGRADASPNYTRLDKMYDTVSAWEEDNWWERGVKGLTLDSLRYVVRPATETTALIPRVGADILSALALVTPGAPGRVINKFNRATFQPVAEWIGMNRDININKDKNWWHKWYMSDEEAAQFDHGTFISQTYQKGIEQGRPLTANVAAWGLGALVLLPPIATGARLLTGARVTAKGSVKEIAKKSQKLPETKTSAEKITATNTKIKKLQEKITKTEDPKTRAKLEEQVITATNKLIKNRTEIENGAHIYSVQQTIRLLDNSLGVIKASPEKQVGMLLIRDNLSFTESVLTKISRNGKAITDVNRLDAIKGFYNNYSKAVNSLKDDHNLGRVLTDLRVARQTFLKDLGIKPVIKKGKAVKDPKTGKFVKSTEKKKEVKSDTQKSLEAEGVKLDAKWKNIKNIDANAIKKLTPLINKRLTNALLPDNWERFIVKGKARNLENVSLGMANRVKKVVGFMDDMDIVVTNLRNVAKLLKDKKINQVQASELIDDEYAKVARFLDSPEDVRAQDIEFGRVAVVDTLRGNPLYATGRGEVKKALTESNEINPKQILKLIDEDPNLKKVHRETLERLVREESALATPEGVGVLLAAQYKLFDFLTNNLAYKLGVAGKKKYVDADLAQLSREFTNLDGSESMLSKIIDDTYSKGKKIEKRIQQHWGKVAEEIGDTKFTQETFNEIGLVSTIRQRVIEEVGKKVKFTKGSKKEAPRMKTPRNLKNVFGTWYKNQTDYINDKYKLKRNWNKDDPEYWVSKVYDEEGNIRSLDDFLNSTVKLTNKQFSTITRLNKYFTDEGDKLFPLAQREKFITDGKPLKKVHSYQRTKVIANKKGDGIDERPETEPFIGSDTTVDNALTGKIGKVEPEVSPIKPGTKTVSPLKERVKLNPNSIYETQYLKNSVEGLIQVENYINQAPALRRIASFVKNGRGTIDDEILSIMRDVGNNVFKTDILPLPKDYLMRFTASVLRNFGMAKLFDASILAAQRFVAPIEAVRERILGRSVLAIGKEIRSNGLSKKDGTLVKGEELARMVRESIRQHTEENTRFGFFGKSTSPIDRADALTFTEGWRGWVKGTNKAAGGSMIRVLTATSSDPEINSILGFAKGYVVKKTGKKSDDVTYEDLFSTKFDEGFDTTAIDKGKQATARVFGETYAGLRSVRDRALINTTGQWVKVLLGQLTSFVTRTFRIMPHLRSSFYKRRAQMLGDDAEFDTYAVQYATDVFTSFYAYQLAKQTIRAQVARALGSEGLEQDVNPRETLERTATDILQSFAYAHSLGAGALVGGATSVALKGSERAGFLPTIGASYSRELLSVFSKGKEAVSDLVNRDEEFSEQDELNVLKLAKLFASIAEGNPTVGLASIVTQPAFKKYILSEYQEEKRSLMSRDVQKTFKFNRPEKAYALIESRYDNTKWRQEAYETKEEFYNYLYEEVRKYDSSDRGEPKIGVVNLSDKDRAKTAVYVYNIRKAYLNRDDGYWDTLLKAAEKAGKYGDRTNYQIYSNNDTALGAASTLEDYNSYYGSKDEYKESELLRFLEKIRRLQ